MLLGNIAKIVLSSFIAAIITGLIVASIFLYGDRLGMEPLAQRSQTTAGEQSYDYAQQTEALFLNGITKPAESSEWWAARSDHRLIAYAIWNCKKLVGITADNMPRQIFTALMLDLAPNGNHVFYTKAGDEVHLAKRDVQGISLELSPFDHDLLSLSDSVARARLSAADGANTNVPWVHRLGMTTLVVAAFATLFVTLQGRVKPVELTDEEKKELERAPLGRRMNHTLWGPGSGFRWVAFFAITLSIAGTSLTGLKQVYDPTRTLTQNTRALLDLRQLHQEIILGVRCEEKSKSVRYDNRVQTWATAIRRLRATIIPEYGAYASLDVGGSSQNPDPTRDPRALDPQSATPDQRPDTPRALDAQVPQNAPEVGRTVSGPTSPQPQ